MSGKNEQGFIDVKQKNVFDAPLHKHSSERTNTPSSSLPPSLHPGMCTPAHPIAAILTNAFLDMCASTGTDLRKAGVGPGQRFCVEARMWKSAADKGVADVPRVKLEATHAAALDSVGMDVLRRWAAEREAEGAQDKVVWPEEGSEPWARSSGDIGAKDPRS
ncbi:hypothetical protein ACJQWK_07319 [Exserohilum turcicum]|uniref:Uncharacterized protein n=1 Tax=Exserohilum turcicum (strain 28A) TaxID=671987 RepID=R0K8E8_EXST2|nr:uncharacterized protein SETTUDRAFT_136482 [Exserohilum turcica Et28A]EOA84562.1 hypothetical protein SETTUDRAFT_136482 [Exserohilum turcica Et28A]